MSLVAQFDKIAILSKRLSQMTDDKTGQVRKFQFVTGFDAVSGSVFTDLALSDDSPVQFSDVYDNRVYNGQFAYSQVNDGKNVKRLASVKLCEVYGDLEVKALKGVKL